MKKLIKLAAAFLAATILSVSCTEETQDLLPETVHPDLLGSWQMASTEAFLNGKRVQGSDVFPEDNPVVTFYDDNTCDMGHKNLTPYCVIGDLLVVYGINLTIERLDEECLDAALKFGEFALDELHPDPEPVDEIGGLKIYQVEEDFNSILVYEKDGKWIGCERVYLGDTPVFCDQLLSNFKKVR